MRITLELENTDVERFLAALARSHHLVRDADESDVLDAAKHALDTLPIGAAPAYVRSRMVIVQRLILMLEDEAWALPQPERAQVLEALVYFSDPEDLIPDDVEVLGLLDDAIMLELLLRRQRHVLQAYADFCAFRQTLGLVPTTPIPAPDASRLARRRSALVERMRRRCERASPAMT